MSDTGAENRQSGRSARERVFSAAEQISKDRRPTVSTVRAEAGVSNADATRYLKEWNEEMLSAHRTVASMPPALLEQASRLAGACWAEATTIAAEKHAAAESKWLQDGKDKDAEITELVEDLDRAAAEKEALSVDLKARIATLEEHLRARDDELSRARTAAQTANHDAGEAGRKLASAQTQIATLQDVYNALLERITTATTTAPAQPGDTAAQ